MRKILLQIFIFSVLFIVTFAINRILMQNSFIPTGLISDKNEIFLMYLLGVFHDIRFLSAAFLPFLLCGFLSLIFSNIKINNKLVIYSKNFYFIFFKRLYNCSFLSLYRIFLCKILLLRNLQD